MQARFPALTRMFTWRFGK